MKYGDKRDYKKIDIYIRHAVSKQWRYVASTTWSKTCKQAKTEFIVSHPSISSENVKCRFAK